ncbi:MAG: Flp pilus assembly complex ATPase component TadA [Desulfovibrio sp.]|jgi:type II secretory ATPase GspE/PulE/Tfp pilus assembly ATPase PilB-like protein|nr:Flp pilus assembly complex ATPase component TadA [Desulfovibrio sp.]
MNTFRHDDASVMDDALPHGTLASLDPIGPATDAPRRGTGPILPAKDGPRLLFENIPADCLDRMALVDGELHLSSLLSDPRHFGVLSHLLARTRALGISREFHFHEPDVFERLYRPRGIRGIGVTRSEVERRIADLLRHAHELGASDVHVLALGGYARIRLRVKGHLRDFEQLEGVDGERLISVIFNSFAASAGQSQFNPLVRMDARIVRRDVLPEKVHSVRLHAEPIQSASERNDGAGTLLTMRLLHDAADVSGTLEERMQGLGYRETHADVLRNLTRRCGMTLLAGPTGSGKSTVLKHIMESMTVQWPDRSYISVEDPPEYPMRHVGQIMVTTNIKRHLDRAERARGYTEAIAGAMRSDPDVLMIGEIRYPEAAMAAIDAALTGHGVWGTIHAADAFGIVTRLESLLRQADVKAPLEVICDANVLSGLCYQRLVPLLCPGCSRKFGAMSGSERDAAIPMSLRRMLAGLEGGVAGDGLEGLRLRGDGCPECNGTGFGPMSVVAETVELDGDLLRLLRDGKGGEARRLWMSGGGRPFTAHAMDLVRGGELDPRIVESRLGVPLLHAVGTNRGCGTMSAARHRTSLPASGQGGNAIGNGAAEGDEAGNPGRHDRVLPMTPQDGASALLSREGDDTMPGCGEGDAAGYDHLQSDPGSDHGLGQEFPQPSGDVGKSAENGDRCADAGLGPEPSDREVDMGTASYLLPSDHMSDTGPGQGLSRASDDAGETAAIGAEGWPKGHAKESTGHISSPDTGQESDRDSDRDSVPEPGKDPAPESGNDSGDHAPAPNSPEVSPDSGPSDPWDADAKAQPPTSPPARKSRACRTRKQGPSGKEDVTSSGRKSEQGADQASDTKHACSSVIDAIYREVMTGLTPLSQSLPPCEHVGQGRASGQPSAHGSAAGSAAAGLDPATSVEGTPKAPLGTSCEDCNSPDNRRKAKTSPRNAPRNRAPKGRALDIATDGATGASNPASTRTSGQTSPTGRSASRKAPPHQASSQATAQGSAGTGRAKGTPSKGGRS